MYLLRAQNSCHDFSVVIAGSMIVGSMIAGSMESVIYDSKTGGHTYF